MAYSQIRDLLDELRSFYRALQDLYENLEATETDPRLELLLQYMGRHERTIERTLSKYEATAAEGVLNTWLQYTSKDELNRIFQEAITTIETDEDPTVEEITHVALEVDRRLKDFYRQGRDETSVPRVTELFESLLEMERSKDYAYAKTVLGIDDV